MKQFRIIGAAAILLLAMAVPSTSMARMYNSARLDHWLNEHQGVKSKLAANPNLIYNKDFREDHPGDSHPVESRRPSKEGRSAPR